MLSSTLPVDPAETVDTATETTEVDPEIVDAAFAESAQVDLSVHPELVDPNAAFIEPVCTDGNKMTVNIVSPSDSTVLSSSYGGAVTVSHPGGTSGTEFEYTFPMGRTNLYEIKMESAGQNSFIYSYWDGSNMHPETTAWTERPDAGSSAWEQGALSVDVNSPIPEHVKVDTPSMNLRIEEGTPMLDIVSGEDQSFFHCTNHPLPNAGQTITKVVVNHPGGFIGSVEFPIQNESVNNSDTGLRPVYMITPEGDGVIRDFGYYRYSNKGTGFDTYCRQTPFAMPEIPEPPVVTETDPDPDPVDDTITDETDTTASEVATVLEATHVMVPIDLSVKPELADPNAAFMVPVSAEGNSVTILITSPADSTTLTSSYGGTRMVSHPGGTVEKEFTFSFPMGATNLYSLTMESAGQTSFIYNYWDGSNMHPDSLAWDERSDSGSSAWEQGALSVDVNSPLPEHVKVDTPSMNLREEGGKPMLDIVSGEDQSFFHCTNHPLPNAGQTITKVLVNHPGGFIGSIEFPIQFPSVNNSDTGLRPVYMISPEGEGIIRDFGYYRYRNTSNSFDGYCRQTPFALPDIPDVSEAMQPVDAPVSLLQVESLEPISRDPTPSVRILSVDGTNAVLFVQPPEGGGTVRSSRNDYLGIQTIQGGDWQMVTLTINADAQTGYYDFLLESSDGTLVDTIPFHWDASTKSVTEIPGNELDLSSFLADRIMPQTLSSNNLIADIANAIDAEVVAQEIEAEIAAQIELFQPQLDLNEWNLRRAYQDRLVANFPNQISGEDFVNALIAQNPHIFPDDLEAHITMLWERDKTWTRGQVEDGVYDAMADYRNGFNDMYQHYYARLENVVMHAETIVLALRNGTYTPVMLEAFRNLVDGNSDLNAGSYEEVLRAVSALLSESGFTAYTDNLRAAQQRVYDKAENIYVAHMRAQWNAAYNDSLMLSIAYENMMASGGSTITTEQALANQQNLTTEDTIIAARSGNAAELAALPENQRLLARIQQVLYVSADPRAVAVREAGGTTQVAADIIMSNCLVADASSTFVGPVTEGSASVMFENAVVHTINNSLIDESLIDDSYLVATAETNIDDMCTPEVPYGTNALTNWTATVDETINTAWNVTTQREGEYRLIISTDSDWDFSNVSVTIDNNITIPLTKIGSVMYVSKYILLPASGHKIEINGINSPQQKAGASEVIFTLDPDFIAPEAITPSLNAVFCADHAGIDPEKNFFIPIEGITGLNCIGPAALAKAFAPILHFNEGEMFDMPMSVDGIIGDLENTGDSTADMDLSSFAYPVGSTPLSEQPFPQAKVYSSVMEQNGEVAINYYFFYPRSNWADHEGQNTHEGDWEGMTVFLKEVADGIYEPDRVAVAQHVEFQSEHVDISKLDGGEIMDWSQVSSDGFHSVIYVGLGGHATYFESGSTNMSFGNIEEHFGVEGEEFRSENYISYLNRLGEGEAAEWTKYTGLWGNSDLVGMDEPFNLAGDAGPRGPAFTENGFEMGEWWYNPWDWSEYFNNNS